MHAVRLIHATRTSHNVEPPSAPPQAHVVQWCSATVGGGYIRRGGDVQHAARASSLCDRKVDFISFGDAHWPLRSGSGDAAAATSKQVCAGARFAAASYLLSPRSGPSRDVLHDQFEITLDTLSPEPDAIDRSQMGGGRAHVRVRR